MLQRIIIKFSHPSKTPESTDEKKSRDIFWCGEMGRCWVSEGDAAGFPKAKPQKIPNPLSAPQTPKPPVGHLQRFSTEDQPEGFHSFEN